MSYTAYNSLLEISFCMDEFAMPMGTPEETCPIEGLNSGEKPQEGVIFEMNRDGIPNLNRDGIPNLNRDGIPNLNRDGIPNLNRDGIPNLNRDGIPNLNRDGIPNLNRDGIPNLNRDGIPNLSRDGIPNLNRDGIPNLNRDGIPNLNRDGIPNLNRDGIPNLNRDEIPNQNISTDRGNGKFFITGDVGGVEEEKKAVCDIELQFEEKKNVCASDDDHLDKSDRNDVSSTGFVESEITQDSLSDVVSIKPKPETEKIEENDSFARIQKQNQECLVQNDNWRTSNSGDDFAKFQEGLTTAENPKSSPLLRSKRLLRVDSESGFKRKSCDITELTDASDPLLNYQKTKDESIFESSVVEFQEHKQTKQHLFKRLLSGVILSVCPYHRYSLPYLESHRGMVCRVRKFLPEDLYHSPLFEGEGQSSRTKYHDLDYTTKYSTKTNIQITEAHPFILCKLTESYLENRIQVSTRIFGCHGYFVLGCR